MTPQTVTSSSDVLNDIALEYGRLVSGVCRRMLLDDELARDAAQQVWLEIVKSYPAFRGESKVSTWIYTITRRVALEHAKRERRHTSHHLLDHLQGDDAVPLSLQDPEKALWVKESCDRCITASLHCFDAEDRLAMILKDLADLDYEDIAATLERTEPAVRQMVSRNRRKLHYFMHDLCMLANPSGTCRCRMTRWVNDIDLPKEYEKVRGIIGKANFFKSSELVLPRKDHWKKYL